MTPIVINRHHFHGKPLPTPNLYIGRGTPLGNPFTLAEHERDEALLLYRRWLGAAASEGRIGIDRTVPDHGAASPDLLVLTKPLSRRRRGSGLAMGTRPGPAGRRQVMNYFDHLPCCRARHPQTGEQCHYVPGGHRGSHEGPSGHNWTYGPNAELVEVGWFDPHHAANMVGTTLRRKEDEL